MTASSRVIAGQQTRARLLDAAISRFAYRNRGDYRPWPGPNSNTFVASIVDAIPEINVALPSTALGKDYPYDRRWLRRTPSGTGLRLTLGHDVWASATPAPSAASAAASPATTSLRILRILRAPPSGLERVLILD